MPFITPSHFATPSALLCAAPARQFAPSVRAMSSSLALVLPGNRREVVKTTPTMTLGAVLAEACARTPRPLDDPAGFVLMNGKVALDLSTPLRFAGLANGARLEVVRKPGAAAPAAAAPLQPAAQPSGVPSTEAAAGAEAVAEPQRTGAPSYAQGTSDASATASSGEGAALPAEADAIMADVEPAPTAAPAAPPPPPSAAAVAASDALAARLGRKVRVFSRAALARAAAAEPVPELPDSFYECVARACLMRRVRARQHSLLTRKPSLAASLPTTSVP